MADIEDYLEEGFDPRSVTMPRLRSILVTHNIDYPAAAKKPQLVALVTDHVLPQAPKIRAQRARAKRSSMGIINAGSAEDDGRWENNELAPPKSAPKRSKSPRKSSARVKVEEEDAELPVLRSPAKRSSRSVSKALSHTEEPETHEYEAPSTIRRARRTVTPSVKHESDLEELSAQEGDESVFTEDNPFQSGGSSPPPMRTPSHRRRTAGDDVSKSANSTRRRTGGYTNDAPVSKSYGRLETPNFEVEPGEEFTPDEQLELEEAASQGDFTVVPRQDSRTVARRSRAKTPLTVLLVTLLGAYLAWYRQEKVAVGYCGLGRPATEIFPPDVQSKIPDPLLPYVAPQCEDCPPHAKCYEDYSVECEPDFIIRSHPLSLGGLVPLPPSCEPDGEKARRVQAVADKAVEELRDRRAKFECGELVNSEGEHEDSPAIAEEELKQTVSRKRSKRLNSDEFNDLWAAAIGDVTAREEVQVETAKTPSSPGFPVRRLSSTSLARISLSCAVKRSVRLGVARYRLAVGILSSLIMAIFYLRARYREHVGNTAKIPALVDTVLGRLASQKELGEDGIDEAWLFLPNLRDDVLRSYHTLAEREKIWRLVKPVVEQNSNVRTTQREGRNGEVGRAWEWIGPIAGDGVRRRRSGRVSFGPDVRSESPEQKEPMETKKWDEPRPIY